MLHLPIHLVEELFLGGLVQTRWMYPFKRYMKVLKGYVKNKVKPEGSMAYGYLREESVGFINEYLSQYTPTTKRAWDEDEEPSIYNEKLDEVGKKNRPMTPAYQEMIHCFVLDNTVHMRSTEGGTRMKSIVRIWRGISSGWNIDNEREGHGLYSPQTCSCCQTLQSGWFMKLQKTRKLGMLFLRM